jgi:hypothetical protein
MFCPLVRCPTCLNRSVIVMVLAMSGALARSPYLSMRFWTSVAFSFAFLAASLSFWMFCS